MARATRTVNPLPFEHLEVHRFEDLVRQLAYDFKRWRRLEATGAAGSDDGFDARGLEIVQDVLADDADGIDEADLTPSEPDRVWLIQCKREKTIGPTKLLAYIGQIPEVERAALYGIVLAAPANFSKTARDKFFAWCSRAGIQEAQLWGRGELEDLLFQPKNDHLLFAYFGISLRIRERTIASQVKARLAIKRKAKRMLSERAFAPVLLRNVADDSYPYIEESLSELRRAARWRVLKFERLLGEGLKFEIGRYFAYLDGETREWDAALAVNRDALTIYEDPWLNRTQEAQHDERAAREVWLALPEEHRATLALWGIVDYEQVVDIDDIGDEHFEGPHIYMRPATGTTFCKFSHAEIHADASREVLPLPDEDKGRVARFPERLRKF